MLLFLAVVMQFAGLYAQVNRANTKKSIPYRANYQRISNGCVAYHNLEVRGGELWAWGNNIFGQLGDGTDISRLLPIQIGTDRDWATVATAYGHSLALKSNGTLWAWGNSGFSGADTYLPTQLGSDDKWISISCGDGQNLALKSDGTLWEWGYLNNSMVPLQVGSDNNWNAIATGDMHNLALKADGTLWAWGSNVEGQLGDGTQTDRGVPVQVGQDHDWTTIAGGYNHSVALKSNGTLWTWGGISPSLTPVQTGTGENWVQISSGFYASFALKADGTIWSLTNNNSFQIGSGNDWVTIIANADYNTAVKADGSLWAWGGNGEGQLGNGTTDGEPEPIRIGNLNKWLITAAGNTHSFSLKTNGTLWSWGDNAEGQLGDGSNTQRISPVLVGNGRNWISVDAGSDHSLGIKADGTLWAWGNNSDGQLGNGTTTDSNIPVQIGTDNNWVSIEAGSDAHHSLALQSNGTLWAWGRNDNGQLGIGSSGNYFTSPVQVGTSHDWVQVSTGFYHTLALRSDGSLWAWGRNDQGQLGNGSNGSQLNPVQIGNNFNWISIEAGGLFSHGLKSDGTLWAWGDNGTGQLGDGSGTDQNSPVQIGTEKSWIAITSGNAHCLGIKSNGDVWSWGYNGYGQLGNGSFTDQHVPVLVSNQHKQVSMDAGAFHSIGLKTERDVYCAAGANTWGQLGDNTTITKFNFTCSTVTDGCVPPAAPVTSPSPSVCSGSTATITATGTGTLGWYNAPAGGSWLAGGFSFTTPPITSTTIFYVQDSTCDASATRTAVTVTLRSASPPEMPYAPNEIVCNGEPATFVAYSTFEGVVSWYDAPTGGNYLGSGYTFTTPPLVATNAVTSYYYYLQDSICSASARATAWVQVYPSTIPLFDPIGPICYGSTPPALPATSTNFNIPGTWEPASVSNTESGTYTFHPTGHYLECNVPVSVFIEVLPAPSAGIINLSGTTILTCTNNTIQVTATGGVSYSWSGGLGNQADAIITIPGTYTVTVVNANGCTDQAFINITGSTSVQPAPVVSGPTNVCPYVGTGAAVMFTVPVSTLPTTYTWTVPNTINILSGQGNDTLIVNIGAGFTASANKQVRVRSISACGVSEMYIHYLLAQPPGNISFISGPTEVCTYSETATEVVYSVNPVAAASSYLWTVPVGVTISENNGNSIKVLFSNNFNTGNITVQPVNNCGAGPVRSITVRRTSPSVPGLISGPTNACMYMPSEANPSGLPATYRITKLPNTTSYNWTVPAGISITSHNSSLTEDYIVTNISSGFVGGNIGVSAVNSCGISAERSLHIGRLLPADPGLIYGADNACGHIGATGTPAYYTTAPASNVDYYNWTVPVGTINFSGQGTNNISLIFPDNFSSGTISVTTSNGCNIAGTRSFTVRKLLPGTPQNISITELNSCPERVYQYQMPSLPNFAQTIEWTVPPGATILNGQGTTSLTVAYPPVSINSKVTATAWSDCGSSAVKRLWIVLPACPPGGIVTNGDQQPKSMTEPKNNPGDDISAVLFPNPSASEFRFNVTSSYNGPVTVSIYDLQGRMIRKIKVKANETNILGQEWKAGVYIMKIEQAGKTIKMKAIKF